MNEKQIKEIGGYIELDLYHLPMLHNDALALNSGRNCLAYLIHAKGIKKILLPYFLCDSVRYICIREGVEIKYYHIDKNLCPLDVKLEQDEWLYIVNYYGQLNNQILKGLSKKYERIIVDNAQAYFQMPIKEVDTIYTCRKFFGVADGAFLFTNILWKETLAKDESYDRMRFLLGRFERTASEFYKEYVENESLFAKEPIKQMSKLTKNLLCGIDYELVKNCRTKNFQYLHEIFKKINKLELTVPEGAFMYPLYVENGTKIRKKAQELKIYIPQLWSDVYNVCTKKMLEYDMAENILPLPIDQRYGTEEMKYMADKILWLMKKE